MATARKRLISIEATSYYHCVSRCVRQSYLCGDDKRTGTSYEHRREWVERKLLSLTHTYCIDVCAYAIMSNHYHLVLHINHEKATSLSMSDVVERWSTEHKIPAHIKRWQSQSTIDQAEYDHCVETIEQWRERLWSLSWFMKELNYDIACKANSEDGCKGHFWESRFKSQALLDDNALIAAMAYVDLNPVRAGIATTPESSNFTSIKKRINELMENVSLNLCLYPFVGNESIKKKHGLPFKLIEYLELVDWTARQYRKDKHSLPSNYPTILARLKLHDRDWMNACKHLLRPHTSAVGNDALAPKAKLALGKAKIHLFRLGC